MFIPRSFAKILFVKTKEVVHWALAVSFLFLFIISSVVFWGNLLLLRELGVLTEQGIWAATDEAVAIYIYIYIYIFIFIFMYIIHI